MSRDKRARKVKQPAFAKKARRTERPESTERETITWRVSLLRRSGNWGWNDIQNAVLWNSVFVKMSNFESMTWAQIKRGVRNHSIARSKLCRNAQKELDDQHLDDIEELFQLGLSGTERIWGVRIGRVFQILWWDPDHTVCPSTKKYT